MIPELTINEDVLYERGAERNIPREETENFVKRMKGFNLTDNLHCYPMNTNCFNFVYEEIPAGSRQPRLIDYGYAATSEAIEKYILPLYGDSDPQYYMVEINLIPKDYEKIYKEGTYINLKGEKTNRDWDDVEGIDEELKHLEVEGKFIGFGIHILENFTPIDKKN